jgi:hypothetical protein
MGTLLVAKMMTTLAVMDTNVVTMTTGGRQHSLKRAMERLTQLRSAFSCFPLLIIAVQDLLAVGPS